MDLELPDSQMGFREEKYIRDHIANMCYTLKHAEGFQKEKSVCALWLTAKRLTV